MFRDLPRGVAEFISDSVVLDARSVALLAERDIGGVALQESLSLEALWQTRPQGSD